MSFVLDWVVDMDGPVWLFSLSAALPVINGLLQPVPPTQRIAPRATSRPTSTILLFSTADRERLFCICIHLTIERYIKFCENRLYEVEYSVTEPVKEARSRAPKSSCLEL